MEGPVFLSDQQVIALNRRAIEKYGGLHGVLSPELLSSAVAMPKATFGGQYLHESLAAMAAAYLYHICQGRAFHDGNKRTAVYAALVFLDLNGHEMDVGEKPFEQLVLGVASGEITKDEVTAFFGSHVVTMNH